MIKIIKVVNTHWLPLFIDRNAAVSFEVLKKSRINQLLNKLFRIKGNESIMCGFHYIAFIEYMLAGKTLLDYINLCSTSSNKKNDKIIYKYF